MVDSLPYSDRPPGDPDGRRRARIRALQLGEAGRLARSIEELLRTANFTSQSATSLTAEILAQEQAELQRAEGRVEPRRRFKQNSSSHPIQDGRTINTIFIDEAGRSDPLYSASTFALGGVALSDEAIVAYIDEADELKERFFGRTDIGFHEPHMRNHRDDFEFAHNAARQQEFCEALDALVSATDCVAFGAVIRKDKFAEFVASESDPYLPPDIYATAIHMMVERYADYLAMSHPGKALGALVFESQGALEDAEHNKHYLDLLTHGTQWISASAFRSALQTGVRFLKKPTFSHPLELADMWSRDLFEWATNGCLVEGPRRWPHFNQKIYRRGDMRVGKFGVKVFPDSDIKELIDLNRDSIGGN